MEEELKAFKPEYFTGETFHVGWAKANITPDFPLQISSYGLRPDFEGVLDSVYVRAFVFSNEKTKSCLVTMDLLIVPPTVVEQVLPSLQKIGFNRNLVYF